MGLCVCVCRVHAQPVCQGFLWWGQWYCQERRVRSANSCWCHTKAALLRKDYLLRRMSVRTVFKYCRVYWRAPWVKVGIKGKEQTWSTFLQRTHCVRNEIGQATTHFHSKQPHLPDKLWASYLSICTGMAIWVVNVLKYFIMVAQ